MTDNSPTVEERVLNAVKSVLVSVIKDTTTPPGLKHPLADQTINDIRKCLELITSREVELAEQAGRPTNSRPRYVDEPSNKVVVSLADTDLNTNNTKS